MKLVIVLLFAVLGLSQVNGHGRLLDPTSRSSLWRFPEYQQFNPPINIQDNELFCGGIDRQIANGDRCGECGDPWDLGRPRENEGGGKYGRGIIAKTYTVGQVIPVTVDLTANHLGYFEYRLCPQNNHLVPVEQACLDNHILELADGSGTRQIITGHMMGSLTVNVKLPQGITCRQCVFQWHYRTANSWGTGGPECEDGTEGIGCGPQETFRGCADITILEEPVQ